MKKICYGIIGFGAFAERSIMPAIKKCENSELVAIQKRSLDMAKRKAEEHRIPLYFDSVDRLVASPDVDAVFIVSANAQHHPETLLAAKAKKHVLVEKPMALNAVQGKEMIDACNRANVKFMVGHMLRFSPLIRRMKEIVQSGQIGEISFARSEFVYDAGMSRRDWLWDKHAAGGGPLFDIGVHCLDSIRCVLDDSVASVQSMMRHADGADKVEKTHVMTMRFSKGTLATVYSSFESSYRQTFIEFVGSKGSISAFYFTPSNTPTTLEIKIGSQGNLADVKKEEIFVPDLYQLEVTHFSDCIMNDVQPLISAEVALHNQEVLDFALKSSE